MRFARVEVSPGIPAEVVRRILRQSSARYRVCYEQGLDRNRALKGTVAILFEIGRDGRPSAMRDDGSTLPDAAVLGCIRAATLQLSFPAPSAVWGGREGEPVRARVHMLLVPSEGSDRERSSKGPAKRPTRP